MIFHWLFLKVGLVCIIEILVVVLHYLFHQAWKTMMKKGAAVYTRYVVPQHHSLSENDVLRPWTQQDIYVQDYDNLTVAITQMCQIITNAWQTFCNA